MKQKLFILISFMFLSGLVFGQEKMVDSLEIKRIESAVNTTLSDSTLQKITIDSITLSNHFNGQDLYRIDFYLKEKNIVRIALLPSFPSFPFNYSRGSSTINYFINNRHLFFISEQYSDNSRTRSCGTLNIVNKLYYEGDILLATIKEEVPFRCYGTPIATDWLYNTFKEVYAIAQKHIDKLYSQTEQYSKSNGKPMSVEEWNRMIKLNDLKIYDTVDVKAKLKSGQKIALFDFDFKHLENESEIILNGTIEKDGSITGINYSSIKDDTIVKNLRTFFIDINNSKIFEPGTLKNKIVRSKVLFKVSLNPELNYIEILIL